jgi:hypothetical protein
MKLQEKIEFINYYYDNVIAPLINTYRKLRNETITIQESNYTTLNNQFIITPTITRCKYNTKEIFNIMTDMMNIDELIYYTTEIIKKFEMNGDIILIDLDDVFDYYGTKETIIKSVESQYNEYFRNERRRLRKIERRKRK